MPQSDSSFCDVLRFKSHQDLARRQVERIPGNLFAGFTGLRYHVAWAPPVSASDNPAPWPAGCDVCCELAAARKSAHPCDPKCGQHQLDCRLCGDEGHRFVCHLGVLNYYLPIRVGGEIAGIAYLQALDAAKEGPPPPDPHMAGPATPFTRLDRNGFDMASQLLRILIRSAETACLVEIRKAELTDARRAVAALEHEHSHLVDLIDRQMPVAIHHPCHSHTDARSDSLPVRLFSYLVTHFSEPITLQSCAAVFGMNAAYLSDLFSHAFGICFKTCLTELRMEKAKELLADSSRPIAEVAFAVGYASENRFRSAFKQATGLPPRVWRRTMNAAANGER